MERKTVLCVIQGCGDTYEALCLDFDLAVAGGTIDETKGLLNQAVAAYIQDALADAEPDRKRLLNRRAPISIQLKWALKLLIHSFRRRERPDFEGRFELPCRA